MEKLTIRVPANLKAELRELKAALPRHLRKTSQDDLVGALIHRADAADLASALEEYAEALDAWENEAAAR